MEKLCKMKSGLLIAAVLGGLLSANSVLALDPTVFPGKGSREVRNKACKVLNEEQKNAHSQFGATRQTYVIETVTTCEEIATSKFGDSGLSGQVARINDIEAIIIDGRLVKRDLQPGEVILLPTEAECMHYLKPAGTQGV